MALCLIFMQEAMPEELQIEELVKSATEPRVAAVGAQMLARGGECLKDSCQGFAGPLPRAAAMREALSLFKVRPIAAVGSHLSDVMWHPPLSVRMIYVIFSRVWPSCYLGQT